MGPVERFTRDAASKYVWAVSMLVAILALVFTLARGGDAVEEERLAAQRRAVDSVARVVEPRVDAADLDAPIAEQELSNLRDAVERTILSDPRVVRLRIWSDDGRLWFSTDRDERLGSEAALNDQILGVAADGRAVTRSDLSDTGGPDEQGRSLVRTYAPLGSNAVVEVDQTFEGTIGPIEASWRRYQILAAAMVGLFLLLTVLSLREPIERINTGVAFAASSIPEGYSLIDDDRLHAVEEVYRLAHDRVARLQEKLAESEEMRRRLEGDIQRALTRAATGSGGRPPAASTRPPASSPAAVLRETEASAPSPTPTDVSPPAAPQLARANPPAQIPPATIRPAAAATPAPPAATNGTKGGVKRAEPLAAEAPTEPEIVTLPESDSLGETWAAASPPTGPLGRATREDTSHPELQRKARPAKRKRAPRLRRKAEPEPKAKPRSQPQPLPQAQPQAQPQAVAPAAPVVIPPAEPVAAPPAEPEKPKRVPRIGRKPVPAPAPAAETSRASVAAEEIDDAKAHEAALEMFIRLTESDRQHEASEVDQGAVRAALARTAARKKPGGHRLQPHEGPHGESPGDPPRREPR